MKRFFRVLLLVALLFGVIEPVAAVFEERDLTQTLKVLKVELKHVYDRMNRARAMLGATRENQQKQMVELMEDCNELSIILYSQKQNFTFDLTYALEEVSKRYRDFSRNRRPFTDIINQMDIEIERYQKLIYTLKCLPPVKIDDDSMNLADSTMILASRLQEETISLHKKNEERDARAGIGKKKGKEKDKPQEEQPAAPQPDTAAWAKDSLVAMADTVAKNEESPSVLKSLASTLFTGSAGKDEDDSGRNELMDSSSTVSISAEGDIVTINDSTGQTGTKTFVFILSGNSLANRDSCLYYSEQLLDMYEQTRSRIIIDSVNYDATWQQLQEAYNYAQSRYKEVQKNIFIDGQAGYLTILRRFSNYWRRAKNDLSDKWLASSYSRTGVRSQWRLQTFVGLVIFVLFYLGIAIGLSHLIIRLLKRKIKYLRSERFKNHGLCMTLFGIVVIFAITITIAMTYSDQNFMKMGTRLLVEFAWLLAAIFLSFAIRLNADQVKYGLRAYIPIMVLCLIIILIRISFAPNSFINIILPPLLLLFTIWQSRVCRKLRNKLPFYDMIYNFITLFVLVVATIMSFSGYILLSILVIIWWIFQLSIIQSITAATDLLKLYYERYMYKRKLAYRRTHGFLINNKIKGSHIEVTWFYDMFRKAIIPALSVWSIPLCVYMASKVFDLSSVSFDYLQRDFLNYKVIHLSVTKILTAISLWFVFNFISYAIKAFYRVYKIRSTLARTGQSELPENMINFTLANSVISIIVWGIYIITCFVLLHIPSTAISIVAAGLATGVGFALKDVINNLFYGISLMSGRLRVGDYVECDGIRGVVDSINYQSTLIETEYGSIMAFPNSNLFQKNFKNLTRNNAYELLILPVGVKYGTNVDQVRSLLKKALIKLNVKDKYGRPILDPRYGIVVRLMDFGDNSILIKVYQQVLVTERYKYTAAANEVIYNTLNANNITIPFPQHDVYIKEIKNEEDEANGNIVKESKKS